MNVWTRCWLLFLTAAVAPAAWSDAPPDAPDLWPPLLDHITAPRSAMSLNGIWEYQHTSDTNAPPAAEGAWRPVVVPGEHAKLFKQNRGRVFFRRGFDLPADWTGRQVDLCFEQVADLADIYINGALAGQTTDAWFPVRLDVTRHLRPGRNELIVGATSFNETSYIRDGKKYIHVRPTAWRWLAAGFSGIPYAVHLESHGPVWIRDVHVMPRVGAISRLRTRVTVVNDGDQPAHVVVGAGVDDVFAHAPAAVEVPAHDGRVVELDDVWAQPRLWWPHDPHLYCLQTSLTGAGTCLDGLRARFGFRELRVDGIHIMMNNRRFMQRRTSILPYRGRAREDLAREYMRTFKARGYNCVRTHGGSRGRICRVADEEGMLIAAESAITGSAGGNTADYWVAAAAHLKNMVCSLRNHPSIVIWHLENESASLMMSLYKFSLEDQARVDAWFAGMMPEIYALDPMRTLSFSGDLEIGGGRRHGPAPTLNYHYPWQPVKPANMLPITADWLERGLRPWQGVAWDKTKPVLLCEDSFPPYNFGRYHGMSQWAGDRAYDMEKGYYQAWSDALRMICEGYYNAQVACWDPWGLNPLRTNAPVFEYGRPMPEFLIATREYNRTFRAGESVARDVRVHNQTFQDGQFEVRTVLTHAGTVLDEQRFECHLPAGGTRALDVRFVCPAAAARMELRWELTLTQAGAVMATRAYDYTVFPPPAPPVLPASTALLAGNDAMAAALTNRLAGNVTAYASLPAALAARPALLCLAGVALSPDDGRALDRAVRSGLKVMLLETPPDSWLPLNLRAHAGHFGVYAWPRAPHHPLMLGIADADMRLWRNDGVTQTNTLLKPTGGDYVIAVDSGSPDGMKYAALLLMAHGRGSYLLCQMPLLSKLAVEPAAGYLLDIWLQRYATLTLPPRMPPVRLLAPSHSPVRDALTQCAVPFDDDIAADGVAQAVMVDGAVDLTGAQADALKRVLDQGGVVWFQNLSPSNAAIAGGWLGLPLATVRESHGSVIRARDSRLLDGLSDYDFWFRDHAGVMPKQGNVVEQVLAADARILAQALTAPAALAEFPCGPGSVIISLLRWDRVSAFGDKRRRLVFSLLNNLLVDTSPRTVSAWEYRPLNMQAVVNAGLQDDPARQPRGWFGMTQEDMRYFPVNATGTNPEDHQPMPPEEFPTKPLTLAGVPFLIINPAEHDGRACLILGDATCGGAAEANVPVRRPVSQIAMLGALPAMASGAHPAAVCRFNYADGSTAAASIVAGRDVDGYQFAKMLTAGQVAWRGNSPGRRDVVLWSWDVPNPHPDRVVDTVTLTVADGERLAVIAMTAVTPAGREAD